MTNINHDYIDKYLDNLYINRDKKLSEIRSKAVENYIPIIEEPTEEFLRFLVSSKKAEYILELGTAVGYSSIVMAKASKNIKLINTVDKNEDLLKIADKNIKEFELNNIIKYHNMDAYEYLKSDKQTYDLIFIDAAKGQYKKYFDLAINLLKENGIIICDNVLFKGMVANDELIKRRKKTIVKRLREFIKAIKEDEKYLSTIVPIGDGLMLVRRNNG